jgi:hypothetical protein
MANREQRNNREKKKPKQDKNKDKSQAVNKPFANVGDQGGQKNKK